MDRKGDNNPSKPRACVHPSANTSSTSLGEEQSRRDYPILQGDEPERRGVQPRFRHSEWGAGAGAGVLAPRWQRTLTVKAPPGPGGCRSALWQILKKLRVVLQGPWGQARGVRLWCTSWDCTCCSEQSLTALPSFSAMSPSGRQIMATPAISDWKAKEHS